MFVTDQSDTPWRGPRLGSGASADLGCSKPQPRPRTAVCGDVERWETDSDDSCSDHDGDESGAGKRMEGGSAHVDGVDWGVCTV